MGAQKLTEGNNWPNLLLLLAAVALVASSQQLSQCHSKWHQLQWPCLDASSSAESSPASALGRWRAPNVGSCLLVADRMAGAGELVAQWQRGQCTAYRYQSACRLAASAGECSTFGRFSVRPQLLSKKFVGAWVATGGGDFSNLVCSASSQHKNRFYASDSVRWDSDGAHFDGVGAGLLLNDSEFMQFDAGHTWLLRLKRQPQPQAFIDCAPCANALLMSGHLWEWHEPTGLFYNNNAYLQPSGSIQSANGTLADNYDAWIDIGVSASPGDNTLRLFHGRHFLADAQRVVYESLEPVLPLCISLGYRQGLAAYRLKGTLAAVAIANVSMTEEDIRHFFDLLP